MRNLILVFAIVLSLPFALAETEIFSGKVMTDTDKEIDGEIFNFKYDQNSNKVFVLNPAMNLIVANGECKSNNIFRVCINSANASYRNITTYIWYYEIDAEIYKLTGSLSSDTTVKLNSLLQGESTELTITIKNPTNLDITNITLIYDLTPFQVYNVKGCELNGNNIEWHGSLNSNYDKTCTAAIWSDIAGNYNLAGNLTYYNGFEAEEKKTEAAAVTVLSHQLKITQFIGNDTEIGKPFYLNFSLKNIHPSEDIEGVLTIDLPSHVSLVKDVPYFDKYEKTLKRSFTLKPSGSVNYSLSMEKKSAGINPIIHKFTYTIKLISLSMENKTYVDVVATSQPAEAQSEGQSVPEQAANQQAATQEQSNSTTDSTLQNTGFNPVGSGILPIPREGENETPKLLPLIHEKLPRFTKNNLIISGVVIVIVFSLLFFIGRHRRKKNEGNKEWHEEFKKVQENLQKEQEQKPL